MRISDRAEEILERLWTEIIELKKKSCDASLLKDDEGVSELVDNHFVEVKNKRLTLTRKGKEEAADCIRRHRLAERLMVDLLDIKKKEVHQTGCKFEHLLHKGLDENICTLLGHPRTCPHGKPIPEGKCCKDVRRAPKKSIMPLSELKPGIKSEISYLQTHDKYALQKIIAMSFLPGTAISLIRKFPSYVVESGKSQFAIDKELASHIYVRITK